MHKTTTIRIRIIITLAKKTGDDKIIDEIEESD